MRKSTFYSIMSVMAVIVFATLVFSFVATGFTFGNIMATALAVSAAWVMVYYISRTAA